MEISILPNTYRNSDGTFNMDSSLKLCGQIAGVCYSKHVFSSLEKESEDKTLNRIETTLNNGHHSVYDHVNVTLNIKNIPGFEQIPSKRLIIIDKFNKADEFYTQLSLIENELRHYKDYFKGKIVFCNCDDPYESNFFKYFASCCPSPSN